MDNFTTRLFSPAQDIPSLLTLFSEVESADHNGMDVSRQSIQRQLEAEGQGTQYNRWVVEASDKPDCLLATALVHVAPGAQLAEANISVHPAWRQRGIGNHLLFQVIDRARHLNASVIQIYASSQLSAATQFLHNHGFSSQGTYTELRLKKDGRLPPIIWPYGYTMHPYSEIQDLSILTQAMNLSYIPLWGHSEVSEQEMASWLPDFNQQGIFLAFSEKGRVVGISRVEPSTARTAKNGAPTGYIDAPGVVPQHRRLDLYRALVLTGIRWLQEQGQSIIEMESWGDKLEVLKMYRELGFMDIRQLMCYQLDLSAGGELS